MKEKAFSKLCKRLRHIRQRVQLMDLSLVVIAMSKTVYINPNKCRVFGIWAKRGTIEVVENLEKDDEAMLTFPGENGTGHKLFLRENASIERSEIIDGIIKEFLDRQDFFFKKLNTFYGLQSMQQALYQEELIRRKKWLSQSGYQR